MPHPSAEPELFIVLNPGSGAHDAGETRAMLERVFGEAGRAHRFVDCAAPGDLDGVCSRAAAQAAAAGGVLVGVGGDGTLNTVAQAAWEAGCAMGVVPGGTFNYFARSQGIPQDKEAAARALLGARMEEVQVGEVNGRLFLVNASLGLYPQLLQDREAFKQQFGRHRWVAVIAGLATLFEWRRQLRLDLDLDGQRTALTTPTLFVGNNRLQMEQVGIGDETARRVGEGRLAAVAPRPIGTLAMVWLMLRGAFGRLGDADEVQSLAFRTLTVQARRMRKLKLAADGEVRVATPPLRFAVAARPLSLMLPRAEDRVAVE